MSGAMIKNPIFPGFNPDPCLCRRGGDYYVAVSSFEWFPAVPVYHSRDLKHWRLITHCIQDERVLDLRKLPSAKGIWAPCLTWHESDGLFYLVYSIMNSMNAKFFDVDNYLTTSPEITGPWSEPVYLHSAGFDPSIFHDDDGRKWITSLEWEFRGGYEHPGAICLVEYDARERKIVGLPKRIWSGGTDRGCIEGPHIFKRNGMYYILCAEGGTGYGHCVTMGRARNIRGPYESDPRNPILTSTAVDFNERGLDAFLKPQYFNPDSALQKSGHGSIVETPMGEVYMVHHCGRPFTPELRCTLGRETAIQKMEWTEDGWLRLSGGGNLAKEYIEASRLPEHEAASLYDGTYFQEGPIPLGWYAPRIPPESFASLNARKGFLRMRGQESLSSLNRVSLLARKLTSVQTRVTVKMVFDPEIYQHYAGLALYYDNMNYFTVRKYWSYSNNCPALGILRVRNGEKSEQPGARVPLRDDLPIWLSLTVKNRESYFEWSRDGKTYARIGETADTSEFSDEFCKSGEFTGAFVGLFCVDSMCRRQYADFEDFCMESNDESNPC